VGAAEQLLPAAGAVAGHVSFKPASAMGAGGLQELTDVAHSPLTHDEVAGLPQISVPYEHWAADESEQLVPLRGWDDGQLSSRPVCPPQAPLTSGVMVPTSAQTDMTKGRRRGLEGRMRPCDAMRVP
jgi:hypothetical protein